MMRFTTANEEETCSAHFRSKCAMTLAGETPNIQEAMDKVSFHLNEFTLWYYNESLYLIFVISL